MRLLPLPYRTGSTWVTASGWMDDVMAIPRLWSTDLLRDRTPSSASELVLLSSPSRREMFGRISSSRIRCRRRWVPSEAAAKMTCSAVNVRACFGPRCPVRTVSTA